MERHLSDSSEQKCAEEYILDRLAEMLGCDFVANPRLPIDISVRPDGIDPSNKIIVEVYARIGKVKGGQSHKIKGDVLKLALLGNRLGSEWRKIMCFASHESASYVEGASWVAEAAREFGIEVCVVELPERLRKRVVSAQQRQRMVNQS